jgi:hypothetical protein
MIAPYLVLLTAAVAAFLHLCNASKERGAGCECLPRPSAPSAQPRLQGFSAAVDDITSTQDDAFQSLNVRSGVYKRPYAI